MPLTRPALALSTDPRSVQEARRWVASICRSLQREELVECAELGVSELVTNALLHAAHPIGVRVRGTADHPRIEVSDGTRQPPVLPGSAVTGDLDGLLATFGRGLNIVAMCSVAWGVALDPAGKTVWFEPATAPHEDVYPRAEITDEEPDTSAAPATAAEHRVPITLRGAPVTVLLELRRHYQELRREVRLLSLAHRDTYPLASTLTEVFSTYDATFPSDVHDQVDEAVRDGRTVVDLATAFSPARGRVIEQMLDLLDLADAFCRSQRLLTLARTPAQRVFQEWFLGEFLRQADGEEPRPWAGTQLADEDAS